MVRERMICGLLILAVLSFCVCCLQIELDSLPSAAGSGRLIPRYISAISFSQYQQVNSEEASGLRNVSRILEEGNHLPENCRWEGGLEVFLPVPEPGMATYLLRMFRLAGESGLDCRGEVIRFIHRKDGEKDRKFIKRQPIIL